MPTYFVNDVVCRVRSGNAGGTEIDIGTVDYPVTTCCDPTGPKTIEELVARGFGDGWEFWVTWGHRNALERFEGRQVGQREKVNASDEMLFLLDRPLSRGMYVRRSSDPTYIGIVKDVEVSVCVQNTVGSVVSNIDIHALEFNWISENMLGAFVTSNGWIGQVVEIEKEAQLRMELDSEFIVNWTEKLNEFEFLKEKHVFPDEWERMEPHLRFRAVGDTAKFTGSELSRFKWISSPASKGWSWTITRPMTYAGRDAEVNSITVCNVLLLWMRRLPLPPPQSQMPGVSGRKPMDRLDFSTISELVNNKSFHILSCVNCEDRTIGANVYVHNSVNTTLATMTYDKWARDYLRALHERKDGEPLTKRQKIGFRREYNNIFTGVGKLSGSIGFGTKIPRQTVVNANFQDPEPSFPGKIIARCSKVAVQFSPIEGIECYDSTDLIPVLFDDALKYQLGTFVKVDESKLDHILAPDSIYYGVILGYDMMKVKEERQAIVNIFHIPHGTLTPLPGEQIHLSSKEMIPHPLLNMRVGDLVLRSCSYDSFTAGTFIRGLETGNILVAAADGSHTVISPYRAISWRVRSISVSPFDEVMKDFCCIPEAPRPDCEAKTDSWVAQNDIGNSLSGLKKLLGIRNPTPPSTSLAFWSLDNFLPFDPQLNHITFLTGTGTANGRGHYFHDKYDGNPDKDGMYAEVILENLRMMDPHRFWMKVAFDRKDLAYAAMVGPVGSLYEDMLFLFEIRLPPIHHGPADVYFMSFFEYDVIPDTDEAENGIPFSWRTGTTNADVLETPTVRTPFLVELFRQIQNRNMQAEPLSISSQQLGGTVIESLTLSNATQALINEIYVRNELVQYISRQILNAPEVWNEEILSFYRVHLPKFFQCQLSWILENSADNSYMSVIHGKRDTLLENLHELMFIYNKLL